MFFCFLKYSSAVFIAAPFPAPSIPSKTMKNGFVLSVIVFYFFRGVYIVLYVLFYCFYYHKCLILDCSRFCDG